MPKKLNFPSSLPGWLLMAMILATAVMIRYFEAFNLLFLLLQLAGIALVVIFHRKINCVQASFSRMLVGLVLVFSGFVKGLDPIGTQYQIIDYFIAFNTEWARPLALPLSVLLNALEFILGIILLLNISIRTTSWLVVILMSIFTLVTINDALYNPVPDCGCFGDVLILSNWQTLYKNLVIDALLLIVFFTRKKWADWFSPINELIILLIFLAGFTGFEIYNIRHLPVIDLLSWKIGNNMKNENPLPLTYYLTYRNKATGREMEFRSPDYPYNDSVWMSEWEFVSQRVVDPNTTNHQLKIEDREGNDFTESFIENPDLQFIVISYDVGESGLKNIQQIRDLARFCDIEGKSVIFLSGSLPEITDEFLTKNQLDIEPYFADDVDLMIMIRSNPGLMLLKNGTVTGKWHFNDFPDTTYIRKNYLP
jgi:uncharacterized membrane protein YphA (DoxX/SURF4 family)